MSAWIVSETHVRALVTGLISLELISRDQATSIGQALWSENHASVNWRYGRGVITPLYHHVDVVLEPIWLLKQIWCYEYQSCEHPGWLIEGPLRPKLLMDHLTERLRLRLPGTEEVITSASYSDAPWGI